MCTNYVPPSRAALAQHFGVDLVGDYPEETYPDYLAPLIRCGAEGEREALLGTFGLIPKAHMPACKHYATMNARAETVGEKTTYRGAWAKQHLALIPCEAVFEPNYESGKHVRYRIGLASGEPFAVAGIWRTWPWTDGPTWAFSMLTINADANQFWSRFHKPTDEKRSVVIIPPAEYDDWLNCRSTDEGRLMLRGFPTELLATEPAPKPSAKSAMDSA